MSVEVDFRGTPRFEVLSRLGAGSSGVVYQAFDREHEREVALKALRSRDAVAVQRFREEFASCRDLAHPNLVRFEEMFEADGQWFFTMELVRGVDLMSYLRPANLRGERAFDETRGRTVMRQLAESLFALHQAGRVHRDVKPANVRVTAQGRAVLLDLGLATEIVSLASETGGGAVGTPQYCAPEQALGAEPGPAADWYSFGAVLFEALTGRAVFEGAMQRVLEAKVAGPAPDPGELAPLAPRDLVELCRALLLRDASRRPEGSAVLVALGATTRGGRDRVSALPSQRRELGVLCDALSRSRDTTLTHLSILGSAATGKSSLLAAFGEHAAGTLGALVLHSRCSRGLGEAFEPLLAPARALAVAWLELAPAERTDLQPGPLGLMLPPLCAIESVAQAIRSPGVGSLVVQRTLALEALRLLLSDVARKRPLVWLIDDCEHLDEDSLRCLQCLLSDTDAPKILLVTARSTPTCSLATKHFEELELRGAAAADSMSERWSALSEDARTLVSVLSLAAHGVTRDLLAEVSDLRGSAFSKALSVAQECGFIRDIPGAEPRQLEAVHRATVSLDAEAERALCARWAVAMHGVHGMPEANLALRGGLRAQAREAAIKLAARAKHRLAFALEAQLLTLSFEADDTSGLAEAQLANAQIGEAWLRAGRPAEAARRFLAAAELAEGADVLSLRSRAAELLMHAGEIVESAAVLDDLLRAVAMKPMSTAGWSLASIAWHRGVLAVRGYGYEPRTIADLVPRQLVEVDVAWRVGQIAGTAKTLQGLDVQTRSLRRALALGEPYRVARALATEAAFLAASETWPQSKTRAALTTARKLVADIGDPALDAACDVSEAIALFFGADLRRSFAMASKAERTLRTLADPPGWELCYAQCFTLFSGNAFDGMPEGIDRYRRFTEEARARGDNFAHAMLTTGALGYLATLTGDVDQARAEMDAALGPWCDIELHFLHVYRLLGITHLDLYRSDPRVLERVEQLWPALARGGLLRLDPLRPFLARARGGALLSTVETRGAKATAAAVRREAAAARAGKHVGAEGLACILDAGAALLLDRDDLAIAALERADRLLESTGMDSWRQSARYHLGRLRGGDHGRALRDSAVSEMRARGITDPERFAHTYATGCSR